MLDPKDVAALEEITNEIAGRKGAAAAYRLKAMDLRAESEFALSRAAAYDRIADDIDDGRVPVPSKRAKVAVVEEEELPGKPADDDEQDVQNPVRAIGGDHEMFVEQIEGGTSLVQEDMGAFIDLFDDRFKRSPYFVEAVNEAAEQGFSMDEETAKVVASRIRELKAAADAAPSEEK